MRRFQAAHRAPRGGHRARRTPRARAAFPRAAWVRPDARSISTESPVSRILYGSLRGDHLTGAMVSHRLVATDPGVRTGRDTPLPLYAVLLRTGFGEPTPLPAPLVSSYLTVSPLPAAAARRLRAARRPLAVFSLFHFPWTHAPRGLPGVLPCGVRTFLTVRPWPPKLRATSARPARSPGELGIPSCSVADQRRSASSSASFTNASARPLSSRGTDSNRTVPSFAAAVRASAWSGFKPSFFTL